MGACASSSCGQSGERKNQKSAKVVAVPSPVTQTGVQHQTTRGVCSPPAAASPEMEEKRSLRWRIDGFSSLLAKKKGWTNSGYFEIKGLKWYLQLNLKDRKSGDEREYVSLILVLSKTSDLKPDIVIEASFKLLIYDQECGKHSEHEFSHHFQTEESRSSGISCMIPVETLKKPSSGFIVGDSCVFGVELIKFTTAKANHSSETVHVQKTNGFNAREVQDRSSQKSKMTPSSLAEQLVTFKWSIDGFSSLLDMAEGWTFSRVFEMMGHNWFLKLNPRYRKSGKKEYVALRLELAQTPGKPDTDVKASLKFLIYDQSYGKHRERQVSHKFLTANTSSAPSCIIPLRTLKKRSGFLVNNCCVFGVEIVNVVPAEANTRTSESFQNTMTSETLFVQKVNAKETKVYTWDIEDFFALKSPGYSPEFEFGGYKWLLSVHPPDKHGDYISLYLNMKTPEDLPKNSSSLVQLTLSIKGQQTGKHRDATGRCQFSHNNTMWGRRKFISLEDFKDPSNGFLVKTKCCIEAEAAIVGSSTME